jgi:hypothetical protein
MTPMISPDGEVGDIPAENVGDAVKSGYKVGQDMLSPDGKAGTIPLDSVHDALKAGFQMKGSSGPAGPSNIAGTAKPGETSPQAAATMKPVDAMGNQQTPESATSGLPGHTGTRPVTAKDLIPGYVAGGTALAGVAASGLPELYELGIKHMAGDVLPGMEEQAAKAKLLQYAPKVLAIVKDLGISGGGLGLLWKAILGGKKDQH